MPCWVWPVGVLPAFYVPVQDALERSAKCHRKSSRPLLEDLN